MNGVVHDVNKNTEGQARQIANLEEAQQRQEKALTAFTTLAQDIGAAKLQPTDGGNVDDSSEVSQSPVAKPPTLHETYYASRRKGFSSTPFVPASKATRPIFGATRTIFKPTDSTENKAGTTTMVNDPSYVEAWQPTTGGDPATSQRSGADDDPSMLLFTTMIDTIKGQTKMME